MSSQNNQDSSDVSSTHQSESDASTTQLVLVGSLNCKKSMILILFAKNKLGFIDRTVAGSCERK